MTRRARLRKVEARIFHGGNPEYAGFFDADPVAGVWREVGGRGRVLPLSPEDLEVNGEAFTVAALHLAEGGAKIYAGVSWGDL